MARAVTHDAPKRGGGGSPPRNLTFALLYAADERGWHVFPLRPKDKRPLTPNGFKNATTDESQIKRWWEANPRAGVAIRTGNESGVLVVDIDPRNGGDQSLARLVHEHGPLPETVEAETGGGGSHLYFKHPGGKIPSKKPWPGIDVKGDGAYVVAPMSQHPSGDFYKWRQGHNPSNLALAAPPEWLLKALRGGREKKALDHPTGGEHQVFTEGERNKTLASLAGSMRQRGMSEAAILAALLPENKSRCKPPLDTEEVERIAHSISRYEPDEDTAIPGHETGIHLTDTGSARRFVREHGQRARYVHSWRKWLVWDGCCWSRDDTGMVMRLAGESVRNMFVAASKLGDRRERRELVRYALASESEKKRKAMLELAKAELPVAITEKQLDPNPWLLNVQNGTLNLRTCELREQQPQDLITHCLPVEYDPTAECPTWRSFLLRVFDGDEELISFLQRAVGYSLTGSTKEQVFFLLYGTGANGKSTFLETIRSLLGNLAQSARFESFLVKRVDSIPNDIARMQGARFVTAVESEGEHRLSESTLKQLTGQDSVTARFMRGEFFDFKPEFKLWLAANHKPIIRGTDLAIWRRVKLIPFQVTIPEEERDLDMVDKLRAELPGILAWAVDGCQRWREEGLGTANAVKEGTERYRRESDTLRQFLNDQCVFGAGRCVSKKDLYGYYQRYCKDGNGDHPITKREFGRKLRQECEDIEDKRSSGGKWVWLGIGLGDDAIWEVT